MPVEGLEEYDSPEVLDAPLDHQQAIDRRPPVTDRRAENREVDSADTPEKDPDGGWRWKSLELSPQANRVAEAGLALRRQAEGRDADGNYTDRGITPAMRRIEGDLEQGSLVPDTERFALKSPDRFKEKLAKMVTLEPDTPVGELASKVHDGIRYTFIFETARYVGGVERARELLEGSDCQLVAFKPSWDREEYKGVNSQWRDRASGILFEVQFHTPESWVAKQATHDAYEMIESPLTTAEERVRLRTYQREVCESVPVPQGALELEPFREERKLAMSDAVNYYAVVGLGRTADNPSGLVRRRQTADGPVDESVSRDLTWVFTDAIYQWERGENFGPELVEISAGEADELIARFRERWSHDG
jgi:hypothetical protein